MATTLSEPANTHEADSAQQADGSAKTDFQHDLRTLSQLKTLRGLAAIGFDWLVIVGMLIASLVWPFPAVWVVAGIVIASRQHALLILMHDACHYRILSNHTWNDRISNWFLAWPILVSTEGYRSNHLAHHSHLNTDQDPDWVRKDGKDDWRFPKTKWQLLLLLARDFFGGGLIDQLKAIKNLSGSKLKTAKSTASRWERLAFYGVIATALAVTGIWWQVLLLWFLPAFTLLPVILRVRSIAEHFGVEGEQELNMSRNFLGPLWERLLLAPHNVGYHLDHHLYPSVPFYNLPSLHRSLLRQPTYAQSAHQNTGLVTGRSSTVLHDVTIAAG